MKSDKIINLIEIWEKFDRNNDSFILNPNGKWVEKVAKGVLQNEKNHGLKYCPCRLISEKKPIDIELICPCNFFIQNTWKEKGECWCGLFHKKIK
jgi:ferredoxin-thioredoxin reductase catalytic chain